MAQDIARVDVAAVRDAAGQFEQSSATLDAAVRAHLYQWAFGGATAGRAHVARGEALRAALDQVADGIARWSRASAEIAAALRASADRYVDADDRNAAGLG